MCAPCRSGHKDPVQTQQTRYSRCVSLVGQLRPADLTPQVLHERDRVSGAMSCNLAQFDEAAGLILEQDGAGRGRRLGWMHALHSTKLRDGEPWHDPTCQTRLHPFP